MSALNIKTRKTVEMQIMLDAWKNNEINWNVSNQHNEYVLESALENIGSVEDEEFLNMDGWSTMSVAHHIAEYQTPELESGWVN